MISDKLNILEKEYFHIPFTFFHGKRDGKFIGGFISKEKFSDLANIKTNFGEFSLYDVLKIAESVSKSLLILHEKLRVIHFDIKPENILVTKQIIINPGCKIKVFDFGTTAKDTTLTIKKTVVGTPFYIAPELLLMKTKITPKADIYSFGVLLIFLTTKTFSPNMALGLIDWWKRNRIEKFSIFEDLIVKCLEYNPEKRPSSFDIIRFDLPEIFKKIE